MKTLVCFLLLWVCLCSCRAQNSFRPTDYHCLTTTICYKEDGEKQTGLFFLMPISDGADRNLKQSHLFLLNKKGNNSLVYDGLTAVYELQASTQSTYTAFLTVGEGHPWIEIVQTQSLIDSHRFEPFAEIQPYPGNVSIIKWLDDKRLLIESDIDLSLKNQQQDLSEKNMLDQPSQFIFDMQNKQFLRLKKKKGADARNSIKH